LTAYLRVLRDAKPRAFLLENVRGLAYEQKDEGLQLLLRGIDEVNRQVGTRYSVSWAALNAANYGVPQLRERVFLIGSREGARFVFPEPTHGSRETQGLFTEQESHRTAWDALGDLPQDVHDPSLEVGGRWGDLLPTIPEGENYLWHTARSGGHPIFGWRRRYWSFLLKLAKNRPAWTIQAQPGTATGPFHWRSRRLTAQELLRLQTFPDGLHFDCGRTDVQRMLGNAVPSLLAEILARAIRRQLLGHRVLWSEPKLLPPRRTNVPPAERPALLPAKYKHLIGEHEAHPGTGRGYARRRTADTETGLFSP
jgi:DNA (cytosine-5)-methyltransferase 1